MLPTCGILITNGTQLLICHPTNGGDRWDIPKGRQDAGEDDITTAIRELWEETGLHVNPKHLTHLGTWQYRAGKKLSLFLHEVDVMPNVGELTCRSHFVLDGKEIPEMDMYDIVSYKEALPKFNPDMRRIIESVLKKKNG